MLETFVHPFTKTILEKDSEGNLFCREDNRREIFKSHDGCYDFAAANPSICEKRDVYDDHYKHWPACELTAAKIAEPWLDKFFPWRGTMLKSLGLLSGRKVLLLGNGLSFKEFYFLSLGASVVFTDLSLVACRRAQDAFRKSGYGETYRDKIEFHAVDAMHLPFPDESFDIIYGSKFVGFLDDLPMFFSEVKRCLKSAGICRFSDDAYSPAYHAVKRVWHPIKARILWKSLSRLSQIRSGGSPNKEFGFRKEALTPYLDQFGFSRLLFIREYFFLRFAQLVWGGLVHFDPKRLRYMTPLYIVLRWVDERLGKIVWMKRNQLSLTWGFDK